MTFGQAIGINRGQISKIALVICVYFKNNLEVVY